VKLNELFDAFKNKRILVIGDVMVDAYVIGKVNRISPEAPVPIISLEKEEKRIGGAGNVALNLVALGAKPIICSVIGTDANGNQLLDLFTQNGISTQGIIASKDRKTTVKTRVISNRQHLLRIDSETTTSIFEEQENALIEQVENLISKGLDAVIFEDYNKGVLTKRVIQTIIDLCKVAKIPTTVDPKKDNFLAYKGVTLFKPNLKELKDGMNVSFSFLIDKPAFLQAVNELNKVLENDISFITLSEHGVFIQNKNEEYFVKAHYRNIADVSGAGDTVIAVATLCLVAGASLKEIAEISNIAGGLVCEKSGVVSISQEELMNEANELLS